MTFEFFLQLGIVLLFIDFVLMISGGPSIVRWILDKLGI